MARSAAFKIEAWEGKAMAILLKQAREMPEFSAGIAAVERAIRETHAEYMRIRAEGGNPIEYMRERGGWSVIADQAFRAEVGDAALTGSQLIGPIRLAGQMLPNDWQPILNRVILEWQTGR